MSHSNEPPHLPLGPSPVRVPVRGASGRLAALLGVGALVVVVGVGLLGRGGDGPSASRAALEAPTATPKLNVTPQPTPVPTPLMPAVPARREPDSPHPDFADALPGDDGNGPLPLGSIDEVPNADRLSFLFEFCDPECNRDAHWMDPDYPEMGSGIWTANRPFHVREGFINDRATPLGEGFDVVLYVSRSDGAPDVPIYRYTSDYVLQGRSDRCGPTYKTQRSPVTCEWFVHDFPKGLPAGRWAIWAVWEAPCWAWFDLNLIHPCQDPDEVISLFSSGVDAPFGPSGPSYTERSS